MGSAVSIMLGIRSKKKVDEPNTNQVSDQPHNSINRGPSSTNRPPSAEATGSGRTNSYRRPIQVDTHAAESNGPEKPALRKGVDYIETPMGAERDVFKFYCPICMFYYKDILATACCKNYLCYTCAVGYIKGKGELEESASLGYAVPQPPENNSSGTDAEEDMDYQIPAQLPSMPCPHCNSNNVQLGRVSRDSPLRNYSDSPSMNGHTSYGKGCHSPLKVGDSFDALRRKMLSFEEEAGPLADTKPLKLLQDQIEHESSNNPDKYR